MKNLFIRYGRKPNEALNETLRFTAIILLSIALALYNPLFQLTLVLVPAFFTALTFRNGILFSIISFLVSLLSVAFVSSNYPLIFFLGIISSMGILVGEINYRKNDMLLSIVIGTLVIVFNIVAVIYIQGRISGTDYVEYLLNSYFKMLEQSGAKDMFAMSFSELKSTIRVTLAAIIMSMGFSLGVINYFIAGSIVNKMNKSLPGFRYFWEFTLPGSALIGVFVSIIGVGIADLVSGYSAEIMLQNLKILYSALFFVQGLSVLDFIALRRLKGILRTFIIVFLIFTVFSYPFLVSLGALDLVFNIRRLKK